MRVIHAFMMMLFGLSFLAFGVYFGRYGYHDLERWRQARQWPQERAQILEASLKERSAGENTGRTYSVAVRFRFRYQGKEYIGTRASLGNGSDNLGSYQKELAARLQEAQRTEKAIHCYVNPAQPVEAVLDRSLRLSLLLLKEIVPLVFCGFGAGFVFHGVRRLRKRRLADTDVNLQRAACELTRQKRDDEPAGVIRSNTRAGLTRLLFFCLIWNATAFPAGYFVLTGLIRDGWRWPPEIRWDPKLLVVIFPLVGLILLAAALLGVVRYLRTGTVLFRMTPTPGVLGGVVGGVIEIPRKISLEGGARLELSCLVTIFHRDKTSTRTEELLENSTLRDLTPEDPCRTALPVLFVPPYHALQSGESPDSGGVARWVLKVAVPGADLEETFEVPVYRTDASRKNFILPAQAAENAGVISLCPTAGEFAGEGITLEEGADGLRLLQPRLRHPLLLLGEVVMNAGMWMGAALLWWYAPVILAVFCALLAFFFFVPICQQIFVRREFTADAVGLTLRSMSLWRRSGPSLSWEEIKNIKVTEDMYFLGAQYWRLILQSTSGRKYLMVTTIRSRRVADALLERLQNVRKENDAIDPVRGLPG